jgi:hypothetical protein
MKYAKQQRTHLGNISVCHFAILFLKLVVPKRIPNINVGLYNLSPIVASPWNMNDPVHKKLMEVFQANFLGAI